MKNDFPPFLFDLFNDNAEKIEDVSKILMTTRRKVLKVVKMKDANYCCKDEGNDDGISGQSVISQSVISLSVVS